MFGPRGTEHGWTSYGAEGARKLATQLRLWVGNAPPGAVRMAPWTATVKDYRQHSYTLTEGEASRLGDRLYELAEDIGAAADLTACAPLD